MSALTRVCLSACLTFRLVSFLFLECGPSSAAQAQAQAQAPGNVRPTDPKGEGVYNTVEGATTIIFLKPLGSRVQKGDLVCELESYAVRTQLARQEVATKAAEAPYQYAKRGREIAELGVTEYIEGIYTPQVQSMNRAIALADGELKKAEANLAATKRLVEKKMVHPNRLDPANLAVEEAKLALDKSQGKKKTLQDFTKVKKVKELQGKVEKARAEELARQADYGREQAAQEQLKKQIDHCKLLAPVSGRLVYTESIQEGAEVRQGELLFRVVPDAEPKAAAK